VMQRTLTKRGVVWLGQTCNLRCQFCYFIDRVADNTHAEHAFMSLEKAKNICHTLVEYYGNTSIDIQGGEPTLYKDIFKLIRFCNLINLKPTLITNALLLDNLEECIKYKEAGISDFLVSVQGLGEVHDTLVGCPGAHRRQLAALHNLQQAGIPFRFNTVMSGAALPQLPHIADLAVKSGALVVNFITFNPFADQAGSGHRSSENVPRYSDVRPFLTEAIDVLENAGIEANVRYFPFCMVEERHRKNIYNFQQLSYDPHEWDLASWSWTGLQPQREKNGGLTPPTGLAVPQSFAQLRAPMKRLATNRLLRPVLYGIHALLTRIGERGVDRDELYRRVARLHAEKYCGYVYGPACTDCSLRAICDGFHADYAKIFGTLEINPLIDGMPVHDPCHFISHQHKFGAFRTKIKNNT